LCLNCIELPTRLQRLQCDVHIMSCRSVTHLQNHRMFNFVRSKPTCFSSFNSSLGSGASSTTSVWRRGDSGVWIFRRRRRVRDGAGEGETAIRGWRVALSTLRMYYNFAEAQHSQHTTFPKFVPSASIHS
jgi:hypothetical protein